MPVDVRLDLTVLALTAGSFGLPLAAMSTGGAGTSFLRQWMVIMLGPIAGWIPAIASRHIGAALWLLLPATLGCTLPFGVYIATRHAGWLGISGVTWVVSGWFLGVAIWV